MIVLKRLSSTSSTNVTFKLLSCKLKYNFRGYVKYYGRSGPLKSVWACIHAISQKN